MNSYEQRTENITNKAKSIRSRRKAFISVVATVCCVAIVCGVLFIPIFHDNPPDISIYNKSEYFPLIQKISEYNEPFYNGDTSIWDEADSMIPEFGATAPAPGDSAPSDDRYEETTLNQVDGVVEGDILKRSTNYAFYLKWVWNFSDGDKNSYNVSAYSIRGEESEFVGSYDLVAKDGVVFDQNWRASEAEMYLSEDAKTLTVLLNCYNQNYVHYTCIVSLDVSNPARITEKARTYVAGDYLSSRKVNGELLVVTNFYVPNKPDFDDSECFIPSCGAMEERVYWAMDEIYCPDYLSNCTYTVVVKVNESNLEFTSRQAVLSYTFDMAVSAEHIFVIRNRYGYEQNGKLLDALSDAVDGELARYDFSEIVCLDYSDKLAIVGSVQLDGAITDRYSLDEKDGILRVVTQTDRTEYIATHKNGNTNFPSLQYQSYVRSASLHCVDLSKMEVVASVENFAPNDESVQAVRFDGDNVYVCTSVGFTDPVFMFDLSDIHNITYKDTGTIPGFSINLLKFGDYLLGIGYGENRNTLKIELYAENGSNVISIAKYENDFCSFSTEYKAHFIDAERQLVGLQIIDYNHPNNKQLFLLLQFDGENLRVLLSQEVRGDADYARAFYDNGLYVFGNGLVPMYFISEDTLFSQNVA